MSPAQSIPPTSRIFRAPLVVLDALFSTSSLCLQLAQTALFPPVRCSYTTEGATQLGFCIQFHCEIRGIWKQVDPDARDYTNPLNELPEHHTLESLLVQRKAELETQYIQQLDAWLRLPLESRTDRPQQPLPLDTDEMQKEFDEQLQKWNSSSALTASVCVCVRACSESRKERRGTRHQGSYKSYKSTRRVCGSRHSFHYVYSEAQLFLLSFIQKLGSWAIVQHHNS
ncbi:hypothetical protein FJTKL_12081 [Diaporthe vaccinii]|uniref:Uncharacterized protein n=1 Tax=Diaporthe vaccinii TaxID=105482 RepID=A0ABR4EF33_9PEZI